MVTHDPKAAEYANHTLHLDKGSLVEQVASAVASPRTALTQAPAAMKYLHLVWASLFRRKTRTILTLVSIIAAFLLFGLLDAVRTSFSAGRAERERRARLQTARKLSFIQTLPQSLARRSSACRRQGGDLRQLVRRRLPGSAQPGLQLRGGAELPRPLPRDVGERGRAQGLRRDAHRRARRRAARAALRLEGRRPRAAAVADLPRPLGSKNWQFDIVGILHSPTRRPAASSTRCSC
jgi:putative ABC transport system permease protein